MSLSKRIFNIAKAEVRSAARKVKSAAGGVLGQREDDEETELPRDEDTTRQGAAHQGAARQARASRTPPRPSAERRTSHAPEHIRRYYANLELPIGADSTEVKAAYRRLMRRYHPDLHQADLEKAKVATQLAQELRTAYEGLLEYLERDGR